MDEFGVERPYRCTECGKSFRRKDDVKIHQKTHTDIRPFQCTHCGKQFRDKYSCNAHQKTHTDERPFQCTQCGRSFRSKYHLKDHMLTHVDKRKGTRKRRRCLNKFVWQAVDHQSNNSTDSQPEQRCDPVQAVALAENKSSEESVAFSQNLCHQQEPDTGLLSVSQHKRQALARQQSTTHTYSVNGAKRLKLSTYDEHSAVDQKIDTGERRYYCKECDKCFSSTSALTRHKALHTGERPYACSVCSKMFGRPDKLRIHELQTHKIVPQERQYSCPECHHSFPTKSKLEDHLRTHAGVRPYECAECGRIFKRRALLQLHQVMHGPRLFKCAKCDKRFHTAQRLYSHGLTHTGERPYCCTQCNKTFKQPRQLRYHQSYAHQTTSGGDSPFSCRECGKPCKTMQSLMSHQFVHTGVRAFECADCDKSFKDVGSLNRHKQTHTGKRPYQCNQCGKSFKTITRLENHQQLRHSSQPEHCDPVQAAALAEKKSSDASVTSSQNLCHKREADTRLHSIALHTPEALTQKNGRHSTGGPPYQCSKCSKSFKTFRYLKEHSITHSDVRAYSCTHCEKSFKHFRSLGTHQLIHGAQRPYQCYECNASFRTRWSFKNHQRRHHSSQPEYSDPVQAAVLAENETSGESVQNVPCHQQESDTEPLSISQDKSEALAQARRKKVKLDLISYRCAPCGKSFKENYLLQRHRRRGICRHQTNKPCESVLNENQSTGTSFRPVLTQKKSSDESGTSVQSLSCNQQDADTGLLNVSQHKPEALTETCGKKIELDFGQLRYHCAPCEKSFKENYLLQRHRRRGICHHQTKEVYESVLNENQSVETNDNANYVSEALTERNSSRESVASKQNLSCEKQEPDTGPLSVCQESVDLRDDDEDDNVLMFTNFRQRVEYTPTARSSLPISLDSPKPTHSSQPEHSDPVQVAVLTDNKSSDESGSSTQILPCHQQDVDFIRKMLNEDAPLQSGAESEQASATGSRVTLATESTAERPYQCTQCGKTFKRKDGLLIHQSSHTDERPFQCTQCGNLFKLRRSYILHQRAHAGERPFQCTECGKSFTQRGNLKGHMLTHADKNKGMMRCMKDLRFCTQLLNGDESQSTGDVAAALAEKKSSDESVASTQNLSCHQQEPDTSLLSVSQRKPEGFNHEKSSASFNTSAECTRTSFRNKYPKTHQRTYVGKRRYECTECGKTFCRRKILEKHREFHNDENRYQCMNCSKIFSSSALYTRHQALHAAKGPHRCTQCDKVFAQMRNLKYHQLYSHEMRLNNNVESQFSCAQCSKTFKVMESLIAHQFVHTGVRAYSCAECDRRFIDALSLSRHEETHRSDRPYKCDQCYKSFKVARYLRHHQRIHHGSQPEHCDSVQAENGSNTLSAFLPHKCSVCNEAFRSKTLLNRHLKVHTGERLFCCTECDRSFKHVEHLSQHQAAHNNGKQRIIRAGVRPFSCMECGSSFQRKEHLKRHEVQHAGGVHAKKGVQRRADLSKVETQRSGEGKRRGRRCKHCLRVFDDCRSVTEHELAVHVPVEAQFGCGHCMKSFESSDEAITCMYGH